MFRTLAIIAIVLQSPLPACAAEAAFFGNWKIVSAAKAPWEDPAHPIVADGAERYIGQVVEISRGKMAGPDLLGCGPTELKVEALPYAGLFEGGLGTDPTNAAAPYDEAKAKRLAQGMGFGPEPVESLFHGCSEIILHRLDDRTMAFGLDNRIFRLERQ